MYKNLQNEYHKHANNCQEILIFGCKAVIRTTHMQNGKYIMPCYENIIPWIFSIKRWFIVTLIP